MASVCIKPATSTALHAVLRHLAADTDRLVSPSGPLCDFLGVDRPKEEFPSGNASKEFDLRVQRALAGGAKRALRNMVGLTFLGVFAGLWAARIIAPDQWRIASTLRQWM